jgi:hypothetical protein
MQLAKVGFVPDRSWPRDAIPYVMKPDEREHMYRLCALIEKEQDPERFSALIKELNDLLESKEQRLELHPGSKPPGPKPPQA